MPATALPEPDSRAEPFCPYFGVCGGCTLQHFGPPSYLAFKTELVESALRYAHIQATLSPMIEAHGGATVARYMDFVQQNARRAVSAAIGKLKNGSARRGLDGGGEIAVSLTVDAASGTAVLDFTGSSDQLASNFNAPSAIVDAAAARFGRRAGLRAHAVFLPAVKTIRTQKGNATCSSSPPFLPPSFTA